MVGAEKYTVIGITALGLASFLLGPSMRMILCRLTLGLIAMETPFLTSDMDLSEKLLTILPALLVSCGTQNGILIMHAAVPMWWDF